MDIVANNGCLLHILQYMDVEDLQNVLLVNKDFYKECESTVIYRLSNGIARGISFAIFIRIIKQHLLTRKQITGLKGISLLSKSKSLENYFWGGQLRHRYYDRRFTLLCHEQSLDLMKILISRNIIPVHPTDLVRIDRYYGKKLDETLLSRIGAEDLLKSLRHTSRGDYPIDAVYGYRIYLRIVGRERGESLIRELGLPNCYNRLIFSSGRPKFDRESCPTPRCALCL